jgi:N6-L-threonylcarbamoyladenine synthase
MKTLGIDTSNYTTSAAVYDPEGTSLNAGRLLDVKEGELGLRQSDALFAHVKRLPEQFLRLEQAGVLCDIQAVAASTRPRAVEGSYMPCFLAGSSQAQALAATMGVPFFAFSHQQGHLAAAAWSAGRLDLLDTPHLAWHLSGGTTELLYVQPIGYNITARRIGGTSDISAGQLIDRTGKRLSMRFPAGKALDAASAQAQTDSTFQVKLQGLEFSLSGVENKVMEVIQRGLSPEDTARFTLNTVCSAVVRTTLRALEQYPGLPVLCSGGVASNSLLRRELVAQCGALFAEPEYSTDNAMGIAILANRAVEQGART